MKKFSGAMIALLMCMAFLVAVAPAEAAAPVGRKACAAQTSKSVNKTLVFTSSDLRAGKKGSTYRVAFQMVVRYRDCGAPVLVESLTYNIDPDFVGCPWVQNFKINPNVIGNWNPGERTVTCSSGVGHYSIGVANTATNKYVFPSDPANVRCIGAYVQVSLSGQTDVSGNTNSVCLV